jgi:hypothetical protein
MTGEEIAQAIRKALSGDKRSLKALAQLTHVQRIELFQFKIGKRDFTLDELATLAEALGLEITVSRRKGKLAAMSDNERAQAGLCRAATPAPRLARLVHARRAQRARNHAGVYDAGSDMTDPAPKRLDLQLP